MTNHERPNLDERMLKAPLLSFSIEKEIEKLQKEDAWKDGDRNAVTLQKNSNIRVVLISLHKGTTLNEHKVEGPITLFVVSGKINFIAGEESVNVTTNGLVVLEKTVPHDVQALEDSTFILTIIRPK